VLVDIAMICIFSSLDAVGSLDLLDLSKHGGYTTIYGKFNGEHDVLNPWFPMLGQAHCDI
jgi:hypothetical protein